jgi:hypothetical protein
MRTQPQTETTGAPQQAHKKAWIFMAEELISRVFDRLLDAAAIAAERVLRAHEDAASSLEWTICDFELSPLVDKQLTAAALRFATEMCLSGGIRQILFNRFRHTAPGVAIDTQRRAVEKDIETRGLPMELASHYVGVLERQPEVSVHDLPARLWSYASIYDDLWSDPRIGAGSSTRRIMLAMTTALRARSAQLIAARSPRRAALGATTNFRRESVVPPEPIGPP